jgi:ATP-dependent Lon protease
LPLRDIVVFPHMIVPLFVGREKSVAALEKVDGRAAKQILLLTQKSPATDDPGKPNDLYDIGTIGYDFAAVKTSRWNSQSSGRRANARARFQLCSERGVLGS